ncbi:MAG: hypothetical protein K8R69_04770, partial [Deltaproteobacteria bacterium]|nr:hypothetical protein [Deltaproteobacteria bacterium]
YLQKLDDYEYQKRVGYPLEFLSGVLTAETDSKRGSDDDIDYLMIKKPTVDEEQKDVQAFLNEIARLCATGECGSVQDAMTQLRSEPRYYMLYYFLDNTGRGKDTLAYIKTMANPTLTDQQMSGESLRLAEKLLGRDDFNYSMNVAAPLMRDPYVGKQAKSLVKDRIPDEAKWYYRKQAIWKAVKDILIVPAIVEGRYKDAAISAIITICSFGVGRIASAGAKMAWAGFTARGLAEGGWLARLAVSSPRLFWAVRAARVVTIAAADNAGFTVGGMMGESVVTGKNQFGWARFKHEMLLGMLPFGLVHMSGKAMGAITKQAEHIPWMKVATEAEAAVLKQEGKAAVTRGWRAALWGGQRMMNASAFTIGGVLNKKLGWAEDDGASLAMMFLQNIATDLQMTAAHAGVNRMTGGKLEKLDQKWEREWNVFPALAKLKVDPKHPAGKAMAEFVGHYADILGAKRGKPLSSNELLKEITKLNAPVEAWLKKQGLNGNSYEAARLHLFRVVSEKGWSADTITEYTKALPDPLLLDHAVDSIFKGEKGQADRDAVKGLLAAWALAEAGSPKEFADRVKNFADMAPDIGDTLRATVNEILGPKASQTPVGRRLMQQLFLRAMSVADHPEELPAIMRSISDMAPRLRSRMDQLLAASGLSGREASLAMTEWVLSNGHGPVSLDHLLTQAKQGEVVFVLENGKISIADVAPANQPARKTAVAQGLAAWEKKKTVNEAVELSQEFGLDQSLYSKANRERYEAMLQQAEQQGNVPLEVVRDLFGKIRSRVEKHVDPMHQDGVLRGLYLDILSGKVGKKELLHLIDGLNKGEITLEVSDFGNYVLVPKSKAAEQPAIDVGVQDNAGDKTQVKPRPKPQDPQMQTKPVDVATPDTPKVEPATGATIPTAVKPIDAGDHKRMLASRLEALKKLNAEIQNLTDMARSGKIKPQDVPDALQKLKDQKNKIVEELNVLVAQGSLEAKDLPADSHDMKVGDVVIMRDGKGIGIVTRIDDRGVHIEGHGEMASILTPHDQWSKQLYKLLRPAEPAAVPETHPTEEWGHQTLADASSRGKDKVGAKDPVAHALIPMNGRDAAESSRFANDFKVYQNQVTQHPADQLPVKLRDRLRDFIKTSAADGNEHRIFAVEFADGTVVISEGVTAGSPFNVKNDAGTRRALQTILDSVGENAKRGNSPVKVYDYHSHPQRGKLHPDGRLFTETNTTDCRSWDAAAAFFRGKFQGMGIKGNVVLEGGAMPVKLTEGSTAPTQDLPYIATYRNEVATSEALRFDNRNAKKFRDEYHLGNSLVSDPRVAAHHATIYETSSRDNIVIEDNADPKVQTWFRDPKSDDWAQIPAGKEYKMEAGKSLELRVGTSLEDAVALHLDSEKGKSPVLSVLKGSGSATSPTTSVGPTNPRLSNDQDDGTQRGKKIGKPKEESRPETPLPQDATKRSGKGRTPIPTVAPISSQEVPMAARGEGADGVPDRISGSGGGTRSQDPTKVGAADASVATATDRDAPRAAFFLTNDGLDSLSVAHGQASPVVWSSHDAGIPGKAWKVEIKPLGDGEFSLLPINGDIAVKAGNSWAPASRSGTTLEDGMHLRFGDVEIIYRKPNSDAARDLATGSRQADENLAGNLLDYYSGAHEQATLAVFAARKDSWGEQARYFQEGMKELTTKLAEYRQLETEYRKAPTVEQRKALNEKWAEVES